MFFFSNFNNEYNPVNIMYFRLSIRFYYFRFMYFRKKNEIKSALRAMKSC